MATSSSTFTRTAEQEVTLHGRPAYGRWLVSIAILVLIVGLIYAFATSSLQWSVVVEYLFSPRIFDGLLATIALWLISLVIGIAVGFLIAIMRMSGTGVLVSVASGFVWLFRGVPVYVWFLIWFNISVVFPSLWVPGRGQIPTVDLVTPFVASMLALSLSQAAYLAEIFRGGILSVDEGQRDASKALGIHSRLSMTRIILPQAMRSILPPAGNESITLLKTTSLAAAIGYTELLTTGQTIYYNNGRVMELLIVVSVWYLAVTTVLTIGQHFLEKRYSYTRRSKALVDVRKGRA